MNGHYVYTPSIWPSFLTTVLLIALAAYSERRRSVPGALPFMVAYLFTALWSAGSVLEYAAVDTTAKIFWVKFQAAWQLPGVTAITCFVLEYAWPGRWLTRRNLALLAIAPVLLQVLILTNDFHHLIWGNFAFDGPVISLRGQGNLFFIAYGYGLVIVNLIVLGWLFLRSPQHRWPVMIMLIGQLGARAVYLVGVTNRIRSDLPLDVLAIATALLMYAVALFGFRIFDPISLARRMTVEHLHVGMVVLDPQERVTSMNPSAEQFLGMPIKQAKGKPIRDLLPAYPERQNAVPDAVEIEFSLGTKQTLSYYSLAIRMLRDFRGLEIGRLLLLRDVTDQMKAQAQLLEQQRALAMLHEREQLGRELHDSLGQVLGYTSLRMEAVRTLIADGKLDVADDHLLQLENIVSDAHADVREYILNLRTAPAVGRPFFSALQDYLDGFLKNYGIRADLSIGAGVDDGIFPPDAQMQLLRIIQEAFSNARRHAQVDCVQLSFERAENLIRIRIQDQGKGFDSHQAAGEGHFGLRFMRERAEALGGSLRVRSAPGEGTCVEIEAPAEGANNA